MNLTTECIKAEAKTDNVLNAKRKSPTEKLEDHTCNNKRTKLAAESEENVTSNHKEREEQVHQSPRKRLQIDAASTSTQKICKKSAEKFIYGNFRQYYGYRIKNEKFHDVRLDLFEKWITIFEEKQILDIGCNVGFITLELAKKFPIKSIDGIDIDRSLINQANKAVLLEKKKLPFGNEARRNKKFPFNVTFVHGNYVLKNDLLLEVQPKQKYDVILALSITKWIHLNFGDDGLKRAFRRMYMHLRDGGKLLLEEQRFDTYKRRKKLNDTILSNFNAIKFFPQQFPDYLLSQEVGFKKVENMGVPEDSTPGFSRQIHIFTK